MKATRPYYERYWENQEELSDFRYKWPVIKKYIPKGKIKILDFGCGKGTITKELRKINKIAQITAVDVSLEALKFAKKSIKKAVFKRIYENKKLPFKDNSFDFIIASDVLEHIYDTDQAFYELGRVLKKKGQILISVPYNGLVKRTIISLFFFDTVFTPTTPHIRFYTEKSLTLMLKKNNIEVIKTGYYGRFFPLSNGMFVIGIKD